MLPCSPAFSPTVRVPTGRTPVRRRAGITALTAVAALASFAMVAPAAGAGVPPGATAPAASPAGIGAVQSLYAQDLLARINADRASRNTATQPVPSLVADAGLTAAAQTWSASIAAANNVVDPSLGTCAAPGGGLPSAGQLCLLAANAGRSGNGFWPGDGSDGMEAAYLASTGHRQNMLNAGYTAAGVGVTCNGGQAWTVELFGFVYGDLAAAGGRQSAQDTAEGNPVPQQPQVAGTRTGNPVYCPGQVIGPTGQITSTGGQISYPYPVPGVPGEPGAAMPGAAVGIATSAGSSGYWIAKANGAVSVHGTAGNYGSMAGASLTAPISHIIATPDGQGYWLVASDGGIFAFGDATFYGSMGGQHLNAPVVGLAATSDGHGYWLVASDGGIFAFGDAAFLGSMGGSHLNQPAVGMGAAADGGYWLVARDGGIFSYGAASFYGSTGGSPLNQPIVGMAGSNSGHGYWLVASDGGVFSFGDASFHGSTGALTLVSPITGMAADLGSGGYWLVAGDGGVFAFDAPFEGAS